MTVNSYENYDEIEEINDTLRAFVIPMNPVPGNKWGKEFVQSFRVELEADTLANLETMIENVVKVPYEFFVSDSKIITITLSATTDDATARHAWGATSWDHLMHDSPQDENYVQYYTDQWEYSIYMRFRPFCSGVTISTATLTMKCGKDDPHSEKIDVYGVECANAPNFDGTGTGSSWTNGETEYDTPAHTTNYATRTGAWADGTEYEFDVADTIQEVIDTTGFTGPYVALHMISEDLDCITQFYESSSSYPESLAVTLADTPLDLDIVATGAPIKTDRATWTCELIIEGAWRVS